MATNVPNDDHLFLIQGPRTPLQVHLYYLCYMAIHYPVVFVNFYLHHKGKKEKKEAKPKVKKRAAREKKKDTGDLDGPLSSYLFNSIRKNLAWGWFYPFPQSAKAGTETEKRMFALLSPDVSPTLVPDDTKVQNVPEGAKIRTLLKLADDSIVEYFSAGTAAEQETRYGQAKDTRIELNNAFKRNVQGKEQNPPDVVTFMNQFAHVKGLPGGTVTAFEKGVYKPQDVSVDGPTGNTWMQRSDFIMRTFQSMVNRLRVTLEDSLSGETLLSRFNNVASYFPGLLETPLQPRRITGEETAALLAVTLYRKVHVLTYRQLKAGGSLGDAYEPFEDGARKDPTYRLRLLFIQGYVRIAALKVQIAKRADIAKRQAMVQSRSSFAPGSGPVAEPIPKAPRRPSVKKEEKKERGESKKRGKPTTPTDELLQPVDLGEMTYEEYLTGIMVDFEDSPDAEEAGEEEKKEAAGERTAMDWASSSSSARPQPGPSYVPPPSRDDGGGGGFDDDVMVTPERESYTPSQENNYMNFMMVLLGWRMRKSFVLFHDDEPEYTLQQWFGIDSRSFTRWARREVRCGKTMQTYYDETVDNLHFWTLPFGLDLAVEQQRYNDIKGKVQSLVGAPDSKTVASWNGTKITLVTRSGSTQRDASDIWDGMSREVATGGRQGENMEAVKKYLWRLVKDYIKDGNNNVSTFDLYLIRLFSMIDLHKNRDYSYTALEMDGRFASAGGTGCGPAPLLTETRSPFNAIDEYKPAVVATPARHALPPPPSSSSSSLSGLTFSSSSLQSSSSSSSVAPPVLFYGFAKRSAFANPFMPNPLEPNLIPIEVTSAASNNVPFVPLPSLSTFQYNIKPPTPSPNIHTYQKRPQLALPPPSASIPPSSSSVSPRRTVPLDWPGSSNFSTLGYYDDSQVLSFLSRYRTEYESGLNIALEPRSHPQDIIKSFQRLNM